MASVFYTVFKGIIITANVAFLVMVRISSENKGDCWGSDSSNIPLFDGEDPSLQSYQKLSTTPWMQDEYKNVTSLIRIFTILDIVL